MYKLIKMNNFSRTWILVLLAVCIYMWQWLAMPLFPDEVAFSMRNTRFFFDDGVLYGRFAVCKSSASIIPFLFYPAAIFIAWINSLPYWLLVRIIPLVSIAALIWAVFTFGLKVGKPTIGSIMIFTAGFIGVAGSGLVLSRPEIYLVLHGAICLFTYSCCNREQSSSVVAVLLLILLGITSNILIFLHPQGLIFVPLTLMLMYRLSKSFDTFYVKISATLATLYVSLSVWYGVRLYQTLRCNEIQAITDFVYSMSLPGWLKSSGATGVSSRLKSEFFNRYGYLDKFEFATKSQIDYLPPMNLTSIHQFLNGIINLLTGLILLAFLILSLYLLVKVCINFFGLRRVVSPLRTKFVSFVTSNEVMFFTIVWAHVGLLVIVTQINFYRAFYLNLAMVVLLIIALHHTKNRIITGISLVIGLLALSLCSASALVAGYDISPKLRSGYSGPSIPLSSDWSKIEEDVHTLKNICGVSDNYSRVIADDMTYDALKSHKQLLAITYIGLSSEIIQTPVINVINNIDATAMVARCGYFDSFNILHTGKLNGLCCANFKKVKFP